MATRRTTVPPAKTSRHTEPAEIPGGTARWRRRKDERPQEILDAALAVFAEKGFAAARMDAIAARARVSKGTIYLYFPGKEAIFRALVREMLAPELARFSELAAAHRGPVAPFLADILRALGHLIVTSNRVVLPKMVIAEAGNFPDLARIYREEVIERGLALFGGVLHTGMARGEFRELSIPHAVRLCIAPLLLAAIWRTTFSRLDTVPYDYEGLFEAHIATLLRGLAREEPPQ
ncbi:MAG TPA: TetR/AcrR family transcriptional regulator [Micropepsaceae bacterium]|jgi:AcrR family transcriptional regulator